MIVLEKINKSFGDKTVYDGFSASFEGVTAILGRSGCGKTTLLNIVAGLTPYTGRVQKESKGVAYMFQQPRLLKNLTVKENLLYIGADAAAAERMLRRVEVDGSLYPKQLSGGMADRAALARAFLCGESTLLMDEPFAGLDVGLKVRIMDLFKALRAEHGGDTLFVTHSPFEAEYLADRAVIVENGTLYADFSGAALTEKNLTAALSAL